MLRQEDGQGEIMAQGPKIQAPKLDEIKIATRSSELESEKLDPKLEINVLKAMSSDDPLGNLKAIVAKSEVHVEDVINEIAFQLREEGEDGDWGSNHVKFLAKYDIRDAGATGLNKAIQTVLYHLNPDLKKPIINNALRKKADRNAIARLEKKQKEFRYAQADIDDESGQ
jgi:hypothetical protein